VRLAANRREPEVRIVRVKDAWGRVYYGWLCIEKAPYLHNWPGDVVGHRVSLDRRLPWEV
jgi:hypothetical protein